MRLARSKLAYGHGTTNAWDEAVYLTLHALRLPLDKLAPLLSRKITDAEQQRVSRLVGERIRRRVPAAYLTREAWLGDFRFYVDERVIVPRSFIAELLREKLAPWIRRPAAIRRTLDLCTGSGCLAVLLAKTFSKAQVDAVDISIDALAVAAMNVRAYRLGQRIRLTESDMFLNVKSNAYDLIIANPPYVSDVAMRRLPTEYRHEPRLALASGKDGFDAVRTILRQASDHLADDGVLVVEVGHHRRQLERAFPHHPFVWLQTSAGDDCVFLLYRDDLISAARAAAAAATRPARTATLRPLRH